MVQLIGTNEQTNQVIEKKIRRFGEIQPIHQSHSLCFSIEDTAPTYFLPALESLEV